MNEKQFAFKQDAFSMTLRDWFAGQALVGILSNVQAMTALAIKVGTTPDGFDVAAVKAYKMADAMLKEREK